MNINELFTKTYHKRNYNCCHFVIDAFKIVNGKDISGIFESAARMKMNSRELCGLKECEKGNIVLAIFQNYDTGDVHVGIRIGNQILHITESGVSYVPLPVVMTNFKKVRYFTC